MKNALISAMILQRVANGETLPQAIDAVLGSGRFSEIVSDLYDGLRAKAAADAAAK